MVTQMNNMKFKIRAVILANERQEDHELWVRACEHHRENIDYRVIDLTRNDWFESLHSEEFDILLAKPGGLTSIFKNLYDERIYILGNVLKYRIYPSAEEIFLYENKRLLSYWLKANNIPHPKTYIFYNKNEAVQYLQNIEYPIVAKVNIGASGSGVKIVNSISEGIKYVNEAFSKKGAPMRTGPNLKKGGLFKRGLHYLAYPGDIPRKINLYKARSGDIQKDFVLFQQYIPHNHEWRVVRIGDSFFAHKKLKIGEMASGSLLKHYSDPPLALLDFVRDLTDRHRFYSQAIDVFELPNDEYLVNEMQCIFGQSGSIQMKVNGKPGKYKYCRNEWIFEEGDFNIYQSYGLRVQHVIKTCIEP